MSKIKVNALLHNKKDDKFFNSDVTGIKSNNTIKYIDNDVVVVISLDKDNISLKRRSDEYDIDMHFKENTLTEGKYNIKALGFFNLKVFTSKLIIQDNKIEIEYEIQIEDNSKELFSYKIEMEEL